jgi:hypothetical protein
MELIEAIPGLDAQAIGSQRLIESRPGQAVVTLVLPVR